MEWTGKKTHLVIIGDLVDGKNRVGDWTNDSDIRVIYFLEKLMGSANKVGGKVVTLLGNHEFMNMFISNVIGSWKNFIDDNKVFN